MNISSANISLKRKSNSIFLGLVNNKRRQKIIKAIINLKRLHHTLQITNINKVIAAAKTATGEINRIKSTHPMNI